MPFVSLEAETERSTPHSIFWVPSRSPVGGAVLALCRFTDFSPNGAETPRAAKLQEGERGLPSLAAKSFQELDDLPSQPQGRCVESAWRVGSLSLCPSPDMTPWSTIATRYWPLSHPLRGIQYVCQRPTCLAVRDNAARAWDRVLGSLGSPDTASKSAEDMARKGLECL